MNKLSSHNLSTHILNDNDTVKRSLTELVLYGREKLADQKGFFESDRNHFNYSNIPYDDKSLESLSIDIESQINSLDLCITYDTVGFGNNAFKSKKPNVLLVSGHSNVNSNKESLWDFLKTKYQNIMNSIVEDTIEDSLKITACQLWEDDIYEWENIINEFESSLNVALTEKTDLGDFYETHKFPLHTPRLDSTPKIDSYNVLDQYSIKKDTMKYKITPNDRLLINLVSKSPALFKRSVEDIYNIVNLSCSAPYMSESMQDACSEIWEIIISLCGSHSKDFSDNTNPNAYNSLTQALFNSIRSLEHLARHQILYTLNVTSENITSDDLFSYIKHYCSMDQSLDVNSNHYYYWKLLYFCFRCGSPESLYLLILSLESSTVHTSAKTTLNELNLIIKVSECLIYRLMESSRSINSSSDAVIKNVSSTYLEKSEEYSAFLETIINEKNIANSISVILDNSQMYHSNNILSLFLAIFQPHTNNSLKSLLPNATAEDFVWYNLSVLVPKSLTNISKEIYHLQQRLICSGPSYFGSVGYPPENLAFAKLMTLAMAPTVALDWLITSCPNNVLICLLWLIYLTQSGYCGTESSFCAVQFPHLSGYPGTTSLCAAFEKILSNDSLIREPITALQVCELIPRQYRLSILSMILNKSQSHILSNLDLLDRIFGAVSNDGMCLGGLICKVLIAPDWLDLKDEFENHPSINTSKTAIKSFESLTTNIAEIASNSEETLLQSMILYYIIAQDRISIKLLLKLYSSTLMYPYTQSSTKIQQDKQQIIEKFFNIFKQRIKCGEIQDCASIFNQVNTAREISNIYLKMGNEIYDEVWVELLKERHYLGIKSFFPKSFLLIRWKGSEMATHLPKLLYVATFCLKNLCEKRNVTKIKFNKDDIQDYVSSLLNSVSELKEQGFSIENKIDETLRSLLLLY